MNDGKHAELFSIQVNQSFKLYHKIIKNNIFLYKKDFIDSKLTIRKRFPHKTINKKFNQSVLMTFIGQFNQITNTLTEKFRTMADGKTMVHLFNELNRATLDAIALVI